MIIARRDFLRMLGVAAGAAGTGGCSRTWSVPDRLVELALRGPGLESEEQTICGLCEGACGLTVRLVDGLPVGLKGNTHHPLNRGGLCPVGLAGLDVLYAPGRPEGPLARNAEGIHASTTWEAALNETASRLSALVDQGKGGRIAMLTGETSELFFDLARQFMSALGSLNVARVDLPSNLPFHLTHGLTEPPGFDFMHSDLVCTFGLDLFEDGATPLHAISALVGARLGEARASLIHVGTRLSPSSSKADIQVRVRPGTHAAYALGVAHVLVREGRIDEEFIAEHTTGFEDWTDEKGERRLGFRRLLLERYYPDRAAQLCGVDPGLIVRVARRLSEAEAPVVLAGGAAVEGTNGVFTGLAVHALNALLGAIDRPGGVRLPAPVPLAPLPKPDASEEPAEPSLFAADGQRGLLEVEPVEALIEGVLSDSHPIEVLLLVGADPVHDSPLGARFREALERIPLVVSMAPGLDASTKRANLVLPTPVTLERWQDSTTPRHVAFSTVGVGKPVIEPLYDSRHPADVLLELGRRIEGTVAAALPWDDYPAYLKDRLGGLAASGQGSVVTGSFDDSWVRFLEERGWRFLAHEGIEGLWTNLVRESAWWNPVHTPDDWGRQFPSQSGRFEFFSARLEEQIATLGTEGGVGEARATEALDRGAENLGLEARGDEVCLPHYEPPGFAGSGDLVLQTFRPLTARGNLGVTSPMVLEMFGYQVFAAWQTWAELSPDTAHDLGLSDGDLVSVESEAGSIEAIIRVLPGTVAGTIHLPLGLGHERDGSPVDGVGANPLELMVAAHDPLSGKAAAAATLVRVRLLERGRHGGPLTGHGSEAT